jgi:class 3 adenylate cyclase
MAVRLGFQLWSGLDRLRNACVNQVMGDRIMALWGAPIAFAACAVQAYYGTVQR